MRYAPAILVGRLTRFAARLRKPGSGSAVPGLVVNTIAPGYLKRTLSGFPQGLVVVSGSSGKSTTTKMLVAILRAHGVDVVTNPSTANISQGLTSALLERADWQGRVPGDVAVLEMDEGWPPSMPHYRWDGAVQMTSDTTSFKARWRRGDPLFGIFSRLAGEEAHESCGLTAVDVIVIDAEHGNFDRERLSRCVFAAKAGGVSVLVRLPDMDPKGVQHAINIGADGVMIPHVDSAEKLRALSTFAKTTAIERAFAGAGRASRQRTLAWPDCRRDLSERLLFIAQLDEPAGVGAAAWVAAIDGVDGIFLGSIGFTLAMGPQVSRASECSSRYAMATSAPSLANAIAAARPMPLSPPVTSATWPSSLPVPRYSLIFERGRGCIFDSTPGLRWCCGGRVCLLDDFFIE